MTDNLTTTNVWLGIIALVSLVQFLMVLTVAIVGFRLYRQAASMIERVERDYAAPLNARVGAVVTDAQYVVHRLQRLEGRVGAMVDRVEDVAGRVASAAQMAWPVLGTWRAAAAAVKSFRGRHTAEPHHDRDRPERADIAPSPRPNGQAGTTPWPMPEGSAHERARFGTR